MNNGTGNDLLRFVMLSIHKPLNSKLSGTVVGRQVAIQLCSFPYRSDRIPRLLRSIYPLVLQRTLPRGTHTDSKFSSVTRGPGHTISNVVAPPNGLSLWSLRSVGMVRQTLVQLLAVAGNSISNRVSLPGAGAVRISI